MKALLVLGILLIALACVPASYIVAEVIAPGPVHTCGPCGLILAVVLGAAQALFALGSLFVGLYGRWAGGRFGTVFLYIAGFIGATFAVLVIVVSRS
jgi:hypothetical protein